MVQGGCNAFMELKISLLCSQNAIGPYLEPAESSPQPDILFI
jgi:hypothetical protein